MLEIRPYCRVLALIRFDGSDEQIARRAIHLARLNQARLAFLHLVEPDETLGGGYPGTRSSQNAASIKNAAVRRLNFLAAMLGAGDAECLTGFGHLPQMFQGALKDWQPDLIVAAGPLPGVAGSIDCLIAARPIQSGGGKLRVLAHWLISQLRPAAM